MNAFQYYNEKALKNKAFWFLVKLKKWYFVVKNDKKSKNIQRVVWVWYVHDADMTDIITNVIGGIIGYVIYLIFRILLIKILK